jgi:hypothetical protein
MLPCVFFALRYDETPPGAATYIEGAALSISIVWFFITESVVLSEQLSIPKFRAAITAAGDALVAYLFIFLLEVAMITAFNGLSIWMK